MNADTSTNTVPSMKAHAKHGESYKWIALSNTTLGTLMASINNNIVLISLPAIFTGLGINPLAPKEATYLLWILMGYSVIVATLLVSFGRLSDIFGRVCRAEDAYNAVGSADLTRTLSQRPKDLPQRRRTLTATVTLSVTLLFSQPLHVPANPYKVP